MKNHCDVCEWIKAVPLSGRVNNQCVQCCARLINKTRPNKNARDGMLAAIERRDGTPPRSEILAVVRTMAEVTAC
jgi:hypothetical protein